MSVKLSILVADDLHVNERNFSSFFKFVQKSGAKTHFATGRRDWIALYGNYESKLDVLNEKARVLARLPADTLYSYEIKGVNLFKAARAETLSFVAPRPEWCQNPFPTSQRELFNKLYAEDRSVLALNMAAAWDWIEHWKRYLVDLGEFTHCCIFSGSLIYQRTLIEILRYTPTKVMVMESFFTGNDYYCEEKYGPIANNCDIRYDSVFKSLRCTLTDENETDRERNKAINKVLNADNKNVTQPEQSDPLAFHDHGIPTVCIIGQVVNDFSVLEYRDVGLATVNFYISLIQALLNEGINVVFKAHPWEEKKTNVKTALTKKQLEAYRETLTDEQKEKFVIVSDYNLKQLLKQCTFVAGLNSQGLLEAAFEGYKPVQFGDAFYGEKGFTHDFEAADVMRFAQQVRNGEISGVMSLVEYRDFEDFMLCALQKHLVSVWDSGVPRLTKLFEATRHIPLVSSKRIQNKVPQTNAPVSPSTTPKPEASKVVASVVSTQKSGGSSLSQKPVTSAPLWQRKLGKLRSNPRKFFGDSKNPAARVLRHLFNHVG